MNDSLQIVISAIDNASSVITGVADNAQKSFGDIGKSMVEVGAGMDAAGAAILAPLYEVVKAAASAQDAMTQFNTIIDNVKGSTQAMKDTFLEQAHAFENLGFQSEQTEVAMARFYQRSKDVNEAIELTRAAMDLARFKNEDLGTAITQVNMVLSGQGRILKQVGIDLKEAGGGIPALKELEGVIGGTALNASKNFNEEIQSLNAHLDDLYVELGSQIIPILVKVIEAIKPIIDVIVQWVVSHQTLVKWILIAAGAVGTLLVIFGTLLIAVGGVILAFTTTAGIIAGAVTAAIIGLVALAAVLILNWDKVKAFFIQLWDDLKTGWQIAINYIIGLWDSLLQKIQQVAAAVSSSAIGKAISAVGGAVGNAAYNAINPLGSILHLAGGGIVNEPTFALIGEAGPEAVIPLTGSSNFGGGQGTINMNVNINGGLITQAVAKQIGDMMIYQFRRFNKL